jgi:integrase
MARAEVKVKDRMHVFRRTWAANAVRQGVPRPYVQSLAGWSTPTMMDEYTAAMQGEEAAIEALRDFDPWG